MHVAALRRTVSRGYFSGGLAKIEGSEMLGSKPRTGMSAHSLWSKKERGIVNVGSYQIELAWYSVLKRREVTCKVACHDE